MAVARHHRAATSLQAGSLRAKSLRCHHNGDTDTNYHCVRHCRCAMLREHDTRQRITWHTLLCRAKAQALSVIHKPRAKLARVTSEQVVNYFAAISSHRIKKLTITARRKLESAVKSTKLSSSEHGPSQTLYVQSSAIRLSSHASVSLNHLRRTNPESKSQRRKAKQNKRDVSTGTSNTTTAWARHGR